jgi:hypothetical protein
MRTLRIHPPELLVLSLMVLASGCYRAKEQPFSQPQADFFPLAVHSTWTYSVDDQSQTGPYTIMETVVGRRYIPSLNLTGTLVEEYSTLKWADRDTPLIFFSENGYIVRVSALGILEIRSQRDLSAQSTRRNSYPRVCWTTSAGTTNCGHSATLAALPIKPLKCKSTPVLMAKPRI